MANQQTIADRLGITKATVSMALRNHPRISKEMRQQVQQVADELGYRPNPYVTSLMTRIRDGRSPQDFGCIAILVDETSVEAWLDWAPETYSANLAGYRKQANAHGYRVECFCLREPENSPEIIDRRLRARGINALILAAPRHPHLWPDVNLRWENYSCSALGNTWLSPKVNSVHTHHLHNMVVAFNQLLKRGCRRIGFCQPNPSLIHQVPSLWMAGYLMSQWESPDLPKLDPFVGTVHETAPESFQQWFKKWKPDGLITVIGDEEPRLKAMGVPCFREGNKGVHFVCLNRPEKSPFPGVNENNELIGRKACEVVISQLVHNQFGIPEHPNEIMVPGNWTEGN